MLNYIISSFLKVYVYGTVLLVFCKIFIDINGVDDLQNDYDFMSSERTLCCTDGLPTPPGINLIINNVDFDGFYWSSDQVNLNKKYKFLSYYDYAYMYNEAYLYCRYRPSYSIIRPFI